ncbi:4-oxalocrotonate tautomerase family protein [Actinomadura sp. 6N118]|uniref:4-oxalocrotonate tautomerase family protein n=1 Tax=Actinomadura sp. 6N118 TaxID=3375151 RepID=UPI0037B0E6B1
MPHFNVRLVEEALDGKVEGLLIRALTDAVVEVVGEWARELVVVELFGVPRQRWGVGGAMPADDPHVVTLNMREGALDGSRIPDAPARLIVSITNAVAEVFGEGSRAGVSVTLVGVPPGRSGVGGEVV